MRALAPAACLLLAGGVTAAEAPPPRVPIPRFALESSPVALAGPARPGRFVEASGRRAAFLGDESGRFEAWAFPLKLLHDFQLDFAIAAYAQPIPGASLASHVEVRPECVVIRYTHAAFTVAAMWLVPVDEPGGLLLLDVDTSEPLTITARFRIDLEPMWPAGLGGQYSGWNEELTAILITEGSKRHAAVVGSPFGLEPPEQPAHNLPDAATQFSITLKPEEARGGLIPIAIAGSVEGRDAAKATYRRLLASAEPAYREGAAQYRRLREGFAALDSPDDRLDLAFEWGKIALDKGFVCNPHLGAGLIAGLGPSGTSERPGFGWFFGGDAFINAWAISGYGDFATVRQTLEFLAARQREDGKMMHELSQGAAYVRWFDAYPYGYYHADTTPLYIVAVRDYAAASGDVQLVRALWPSLRRAFEYCTLMDDDGDGLMDNLLAGLAAVETGKLRSKDVQTDVFLAAAWADAAAATVDLAAVAEPAFAATARAAAERARTALASRFLDDERRRVYFALLIDRTARAEPTVWPAYGIWRGVFDASRPAIAGELDELAGAGLAADWGARMLSRESALYEPLSYNNGAVWPFLTGYAALALYSQQRAPAAWAYLDGTADLTFLEARGFVPELLSGDRARSLDAAVPHQLFATTGLMATIVRGLLGLAAVAPPGGTPLEAGAIVRLAPQLPPEWPSLRVTGLRFRELVFDIEMTQNRGGIEARVTPRRGGALPVELVLSLPAGARATTVHAPGPSRVAESPRGARVTFTARIENPERFRVEHTGGFTITAVHRPLASGDRSTRVRVVDAVVENDAYRVRLQGLAGRSYRLRLGTPFAPRTLLGVGEVGREGGRHLLEITFPSGGSEWVDGELVADRSTRRIAFTAGGSPTR